MNVFAIAQALVALDEQLRQHFIAKIQEIGRFAEIHLPPSGNVTWRRTITLNYLNGPEDADLIKFVNRRLIESLNNKDLADLATYFHNPAEQNPAQTAAVFTTPFKVEEL